MTPIDVRPADLDTVRRILRENVPALEVHAFGSRVAWNARETSDLDVALMTTKPLSIDRTARLRAAFTDSDLPFRVDMVDWATISESFRQRILENHVALRAERDEWPIRRFEELLDEPVRNGIYKSKEHHGHGVKIVNMGEIFGHSRLRAVPMRRVGLSESEIERFAVAKGDLLFARRSLVAEGAGKCCVVLDVDEPTTFESSIIRARPAATTSDPLYLYYFFCSPSGLHCLDTIRRQVAVAGITGRDLSGLEIPAPPLPEQRAIAHILGTLDDKIELNRRMNATLEAMARALFRSWFVDFDPVRAKMAGRDTGLPKEIADPFPDRLVDSELGEIPEGWALERLSEHFEAVRGVSYKGSGLGRDGVPLHNLNSIHEDGGYKYEGIKYYAREYTARHVVRPGDVIVANTEQGHYRLLIGYAAIVPRLFGDHGICSHHLYRLRPRSSGHLSAPFLHLLLNSPWMHDLVSGYANGTTVNMLPMDAVQKPIVVVPPMTLLEAFDVLALRLEHRREQTVRDSRSLGVLRDTLLPKLLSGEIRVRAAEKLVGAIT